MSEPTCLLVAIPWPRVLKELTGFLAYFAIFGALGLRFVVVRSRPDGNDALSFIYDRVLRTAGLIGGIGTLLLLPGMLGGHGMNVLTLGMAGAIFAGFALILAKVRGGWVVAGIAGLVFALKNLAKGKLLAMVNPIHALSASLWLGTLFVLVVAVLSAVLDGPVSRDQRGPLAARLVARFSQLALASTAVLLMTGLVTAWVHLKYVSALWTTPYGQTLLVKLSLVAIVAGLGAYNWRRVRPRLGTESATAEIRRSSSLELGVGFGVLIVTALLVSFPSPKLPKGPRSEGAASASAEQAIRPGVNHP